MSACAFEAVRRRLLATKPLVPLVLGKNVFFVLDVGTKTETRPWNSADARENSYISRGYSWPEVQGLGFGPLPPCLDDTDL